MFQQIRKLQLKRVTPRGDENLIQKNSDGWGGHERWPRERRMQFRTPQKPRLSGWCWVVNNYNALDFKLLLWILRDEHMESLKCENRYKYPPRAEWFCNSLSLLKTVVNPLRKCDDDRMRTIAIIMGVWWNDGSCCKAFVGISLWKAVVLIMKKWSWWGSNSSENNKYRDLLQW